MFRRRNPRAASLPQRDPREEQLKARLREELARQQAFVRAATIVYLHRDRDDAPDDPCSPP